jgi:hypothetical protein
MADHLEELLKDTPMGRMKLLAAWDSLSTETQIRLLGELSAKNRTGVPDRPIWLKALSSPSEYLRYLAARRVRFPRDDEIEKKVMSDSSPLVRYSDVTGMTLLDKLSNEDFDRYPKEQKLAIVSNDDPPEATKLASWVEHAVETKSVGDNEIYDAVLEYLCNPEVLRWLQESSYDYFGDTAWEEGFKALWGLLPKVPTSVAHSLVVHLPWEGVRSAEPPSEVLTWLETSPYLESLLWREDAPLLELRRKVFFSTDPKYDGIKPAAVSHNFCAAPEELHELFTQNSKLLDTLAAFCDFPVGGPLAEFTPFTPVTVLALKDSAWARRSDPFLVDKDKLEQRFKSALAELKGSDREKGLRLLKIYRLAQKVVRWSRDEYGPDLSALPEPLNFLGDKVISGDTWGTFIGFAERIDWRFGRFDHLLPHLEEGLAPDSDEASAAGVAKQGGVGDALDKQELIEATTPPMQANPAQHQGVLGNVVIVLAGCGKRIVSHSIIR